MLTSFNTTGLAELGISAMSLALGSLGSPILADLVDLVASSPLSDEDEDSVPLDEDEEDEDESSSSSSSSDELEPDVDESPDEEDDDEDPSSSSSSSDEESSDGPLALLVFSLLSVLSRFESFSLGFGFGLELVKSFGLVGVFLSRDNGLDWLSLVLASSSFDLVARLVLVVVLVLLRLMFGLSSRSLSFSLSIRSESFTVLE